MSISTLIAGTYITMKRHQSSSHDAENPSKVAKLSDKAADEVADEAAYQFHLLSQLKLIFWNEFLSDLIVNYVLTVTIKAGQMEAMLLNKQDYTSLGNLLEVNKFFYRHPHLNEYYWKAKIHSHFPGMALSNNPIENIQDPLIKEGLTQMKATQYKALINEIQAALKKAGLEKIEGSQLTPQNETTKGKAQLIEKISEKIDKSASKAQLIEKFSKKIDASRYMGRDKSHFDYFVYLIEQFFKREMWAGGHSVQSIYRKLLLTRSQGNHKENEDKDWYGDLIKETQNLTSGSCDGLPALFFSNMITHESQKIRSYIYAKIRFYCGTLREIASTSIKPGKNNPLKVNFYNKICKEKPSQARLDLVLDDKKQHFIPLRLPEPSDVSRPALDFLDYIHYQADLFYQKHLRIPVATVEALFGPIEKLNFFDNSKEQFNLDVEIDGYLALMNIIRDEHIIPLGKIFRAFAAIMFNKSPSFIKNLLEKQPNLEAVLRDYTTIFHSKALRLIEKCHTLDLINRCNTYLINLPKYENLVKLYHHEASSLTETFKFFYEAELMHKNGDRGFTEAHAGEFIKENYPNLLNPLENDEEGAKRVNKLKTFICSQFHFLTQGPKLAELAAPIEPITFNLLTYIALFYPQLLDDEKFAALLTKQSVDVEKVKQEINSIQANLSKIALLIPIVYIEEQENWLQTSVDPFSCVPFSLQYHPIQNLSKQSTFQNFFMAFDATCLNYTSQWIHEWETFNKASFSQALIERPDSADNIPENLLVDLANNALPIHKEAMRQFAARLSLHLLSVDQTKVSPEALENLVLSLGKYAISHASGDSEEILNFYVNCFNEYEESIAEMFISPYIIILAKLLRDEMFESFLLPPAVRRNNKATAKSFLPQKFTVAIPVFFREIFESLIGNSFKKAHIFWRYIVSCHLENWAKANDPQDLIAKVHDAKLTLQTKSNCVVAPFFSSTDFFSDVTNEFIKYCPDPQWKLTCILLALNHLKDENKDENKVGNKVLQGFFTGRIADIAEEAFKCANHNYDFLENPLNCLFNSDCINTTFELKVADSLLQVFSRVFPDEKQWQFEEKKLYQKLLAYHGERNSKMPTDSLNKPPQPPAVISQQDDKALTPQSLQQINPVDLVAPVQQATTQACQGSHLGFFNVRSTEEIHPNSSNANHNQPSVAHQFRSPL